MSCIIRFAHILPGSKCLPQTSHLGRDFCPLKPCPSSPVSPLAFRSIALQQVQETSPNIQISTTEGIRYRNLTPWDRSWSWGVVAFFLLKHVTEVQPLQMMSFASVFRALFVHNWMIQHQLIYRWPIHLLISILLQLPVLKSPCDWKAPRLWLVTCGLPLFWSRKA